MTKCKRCKDFLFLDKPCNCKLFVVTDDEDEEVEIYAMHSDDAAERWAIVYNQDNDYALVDDEVKITVDGVPYFVSAEPSIIYHVMEVGEDDTIETTEEVDTLGTLPTDVT